MTAALEGDPLRGDAVPGVPLGDPLAWGLTLMELEKAGDFRGVEKFYEDLAGPDDANGVNEFWAISEWLSYLTEGKDLQRAAIWIFGSEEHLQEVEERLKACTDRQAQLEILGQLNKRERACMVEFAAHKYAPLGVED